MVVPKHYTRDLGPTRSGTLEGRDHPFPVETSQGRDADPDISTKSHWCAHLGGLGDWVINSRGEPAAGCSKEQPRMGGWASRGSSSRP